MTNNLKLLHSKSIVSERLRNDGLDDVEKGEREREKKERDRAREKRWGGRKSNRKGWEEERNKKRNPFIIKYLIFYAIPVLLFRAMKRKKKGFCSFFLIGTH